METVKRGVMRPHLSVNSHGVDEETDTAGSSRELFYNPKMGVIEYSCWSYK